jgi:hypothetical protein
VVADDPARADRRDALARRVLPGLRDEPKILGLHALPPASKATEAALEGKKYTFILDKPYRWESWAAPKDKDGALDPAGAWFR